MSNVVQILKDARALIADEKNWREIGALEALARAAGMSSDSPLPGEFYLTDEAFEAGEVNLEEFNDRRTHAEVLDLFDRAIAHADSELAPC